MQIIGGNRQWQCDNDCYQLLHDDVYAPFPPSSITHACAYTHTHTILKLNKTPRRNMNWWFATGRGRRRRREEEEEEEEEEKEKSRWKVYDHLRLHLYQVINAAFCVHYYVRQFSHTSAPPARGYKSVQNRCTSAWILYRVLYPSIFLVFTSFAFFFFFFFLVFFSFF